MTRIAQIEALQIELLANPRSLSFTQLGDLYIAENMIEEAHSLLQRSLKFHPYSISGHMLLGRIYQVTDRSIDAINEFDFCIQKAPDNWMCILLRAQTYLKLHQYKKAFADFKMVLLLNPQNSSASRAIAKIDSLALNQNEDVENFQEFKLKNIGTKQIFSKPDSLPPALNPKMERILSLVDALSARQEYQRALQLLKECQSEYGQHVEIDMRRLKLSQHESAQKIRPKVPEHMSLSKKLIIYEKQKKALELLLRRIVDVKNSHSLV